MELSYEHSFVHNDSLLSLLLSRLSLFLAFKSWIMKCLDADVFNLFYLELIELLGYKD